MLNWIIDNWYIVLGIAALLICVGYTMVKFLGLPTKEQVRKIKELLLYWVTEAEAEFGGGTGTIKLRYVYDLFTSKFPVLAKIISFEKFSEWVDEALVQMRELLMKNENIKAIVENK